MKNFLWFVLHLKQFSQYWCNCQMWPFSVIRNDEWEVHKLITDVKWTKTSIARTSGGGHASAPPPLDPPLWWSFLYHTWQTKYCLQIPSKNLQRVNFCYFVTAFYWLIHCAFLLCFVYLSDCYFHLLFCSFGFCLPCWNVAVYNNVELRTFVCTMVVALSRFVPDTAIYLCWKGTLNTN